LQKIFLETMVVICVTLNQLHEKLSLAQTGKAKGKRS
jgi:hypothetical protein